MCVHYVQRRWQITDIQTHRHTHGQVCTHSSPINQRQCSLVFSFSFSVALEPNIHCNQRARCVKHTNTNANAHTLASMSVEATKKLLLFNCCYDLVPPYYMLYVCAQPHNKWKMCGRPYCRRRRWRRCCCCCCFRCRARFIVVVNALNTNIWVRRRQRRWWKTNTQTHSLTLFIHLCANSQHLFHISRCSSLTRWLVVDYVAAAAFSSHQIYLTSLATTALCVRAHTLSTSQRFRYSS